MTIFQLHKFVPTSKCALLIQRNFSEPICNDDTNCSSSVLTGRLAWGKCEETKPLYAAFNKISSQFKRQKLKSNVSTI